MSEKNWWLKTSKTEPGKPGATGLFNLDQAQSIEVISPDKILLRFSENQTVSFVGQEAKDLLRHVMTKVVDPGPLDQS